MTIKSFLSLLFAKLVVLQNKKWKNNALKAQKKIMLNLVGKAQNTLFGSEHSFEKIRTYGGIPEMTLIFSEIVSSTIASTFFSQSEIQFVL